MGRPRGSVSGSSYGLRRRSSNAAVNPMLYNSGVELMMECVDDALSPSQVEANRKAKEEFNKAQKMIEEARAEVARIAAKAEAERVAAAEAAAAAAAAAAKLARQNNSVTVRNSSGSTSPDIMIVGESPPRMTQKQLSPRPTQLTAATPKPTSGPIMNPTTTQGILPPRSGVGTVPQYRFVNHGRNNISGTNAQPNHVVIRPIMPIMPHQQGPAPIRPSVSQSIVHQMVSSAPGTLGMATIVSGTSGLGIKRPIGAADDLMPSPALKRPRGPPGRPDSNNGGGGNWVPLDEYYYGKMEGDPTYLEDKAEFRFRCWMCTKMLYNNVKAMMHLQGHIDSEKQQNLDLSDLTQCKHCYKQFDTPFEMQTHIEKVHLSNKNVLMCRICEKDHESRGALTTHMRHNHCACEMPYTCQLCHFRSSMYSDVVDHFKKKHDSSDCLLCLYCLRVFHVKFVSQGWGQTQTYYHHLLRHQSKTTNRKCTFCKLSFFNAQDMKQHRKTHHQPNQKGVIGVNPKQNSADQVMIKVPETGIVSNKTAGPKSLNAPTVSKVTEHRGLRLPPRTAISYCFECKMLMNTSDHYKKYIQCSMCRFATSCSFGYATHMMGFHSGQVEALSRSVPMERPLPASLYCLCGFSSKLGNKLANHLVFCSKRTGYLNKPEVPSTEKPGQADELDPRHKPDASILDVLGLVKKQSVVNPRSIPRQPPLSTIHHFRLGTEDEEGVSAAPDTHNIPDVKNSPLTASHTEDDKSWTSPHRQAEEPTEDAATPAEEPSLGDIGADTSSLQHPTDSSFVDTDTSTSQDVSTSIHKMPLSQEEEEEKGAEQKESMEAGSEADKEPLSEALAEDGKETASKIHQKEDGTGAESVELETKGRVEDQVTEPSTEDRDITSPTAAYAEEGNPQEGVDEESMEVDNGVCNADTEGENKAAPESNMAIKSDEDLEDNREPVAESQLERTGEDFEEEVPMDTDDVDHAVLPDNQYGPAQSGDAQGGETTQEDHDAVGRVPSQDLVPEPSAQQEDVTMDEEQELLGTSEDADELPTAEDTGLAVEQDAEFSQEENTHATFEESHELTEGNDMELPVEDKESAVEKDQENASEVKDLPLEEDMALAPEGDKDFIQEEEKELSVEEERESVPEESSDMVPEQNQEMASEESTAMAAEGGEAAFERNYVPTVEEEQQQNETEENYIPTAEEEQEQENDSEHLEPEYEQADTEKETKSEDDNDLQDDTSKNDEENISKDVTNTETRPEDNTNEETQPEDNTNKDTQPEDTEESKVEKLPETAPETKADDMYFEDKSSQQIPEDSADTQTHRGSEDTDSGDLGSGKRSRWDEGSKGRGPVGGSSQPVPQPGRPEDSEAARQDGVPSKDKSEETLPAPPPRPAQSAPPPPQPPAVSASADKGRGGSGSGSSYHQPRPYSSGSSDRDRQHSRDHDHRDRSYDRNRDHSSSYSDHRDYRRDRDRDYYNRSYQYDRHRDQRYDSQHGRYQQGGYGSQQDRYYNQNRSSNRGGQNRHGYNDRNYYRGYY